MSTSIYINPADLGCRADADALLMLIDAYASDPMGDGRGLSAEARACLIPALRGLPGAFVLLARADRAPVGVAVCFAGFSTFRARGLFNVHDLAVLPAWRGQGIGRRLLRAVEDEASSRGYCKVTLEVRADNPAQGLYRRLGYGAGSNGDRAVQYLFLERRLSNSG